MKAWHGWSKAQRVTALLFGWHPVLIVVTTAMRWNVAPTEETFRSIVQFVGWSFITIIAIGIAGIFSWGTKEVKKEIASGQQRYEQLPELGKIRVDRGNAQVAKYGGAALAGVFALAVVAINPWAWGGAIIAGRAAVRNWRDQDETIHELDAKRAKAIR